MGHVGDIATARLDAAACAENFADIKPPLGPVQARLEAARCLFCHDAPCVEACPTGIDVPSFIGKIASGNLVGAGYDILRVNILGGSCARVCPTEILCERACVRHAADARPVAIGALQRFATDPMIGAATHLFARAPSSGQRVAVVGAGPAGLACAHRLAVHGHAVVVFEAGDKPGGLNEYGIAAYKLVDGFAGREVDFVLGVGGIEVRPGQALGRDVTLDGLRHEFDAVFVGIGLAGVNGLGIEGEDLAGVADAVAYLRDLRQATAPNSLAVGRRVVVIGGGNTAIDIAIQSRLLGAEDVTLVYRRGPEQMGATEHERDLAQTRGVRIRFWAKPSRVLGRGGAVAGVAFERTELDASGRVAGTGQTFEVDADMVFKAIGQAFRADPLGADGPALALGRIRVDGEYRTSLDDVFAGGDCVPGLDLTVEAVRDGRQAAEAIHRQLSGLRGVRDHD